MKQKTLTTDKATLLVVEMPRGVKNVRVNNARGIFGYTDKINIVRWEALEFGNWQLLGRLPDITEEGISKVADSITFEDEEFGNYTKYRNYAAKTISPHGKLFEPISAIDAFYTLLQASEVYFENTLGKLHPTHPAYTGQGITVEEWLEKCKKWQEAQSKVWDKERTYLFIKVE